VIDRAQKLAAELFGADQTWFLVNGCSGGIHAAVMATCGPGQTLLVARNCHLSVFSAMVLSGALVIARSPPLPARGAVRHQLPGPVPRARDERSLRSHRLSRCLPAPQAASPGGSSQSATSSTASRTASRRRRCARPCSRRSRQGATWAPSCSCPPPTTAPQLAWQVGGPLSCAACLQGAAQADRRCYPADLLHSSLVTHRSSD
jgi:hypothetical protein